eukprot:GHVL01023492.1.p3 GENE.GHVL01023492.1~~GHVL01023492.1.p3  ORF type:complete len:166 (-),score=13.49 GHVL01023492.1:497-994(-)
MFDEVDCENDVEHEEHCARNELEHDGVTPRVDLKAAALSKVGQGHPTCDGVNGKRIHCRKVLQGGEDENPHQSYHRESRLSSRHLDLATKDDDQASLDGQQNGGPHAGLEEDVADTDVDVGLVEVERVLVVKVAHGAPDETDGQDEHQAQNVKHSQAFKVYERST